MQLPEAPLHEKSQNGLQRRPVHRHFNYSAPIQLAAGSLDFARHSEADEVLSHESVHSGEIVISLSFVNQAPLRPLHKIIKRIPGSQIHQLENGRRPGVVWCLQLGLCRRLIQLPAINQ